MSYAKDPNCWVSRYAQKLYSFAKSRTGSQLAAEDLVQETLLSACQSDVVCDSLAGEERWLFHILRNKITDWYRQQAKRADLRKEDAIDMLFDSDGEWLHDLPRWKCPSDIFSNKEFHKTFWNCVDNLNKRVKMPLIMRDIDNHSSRDIMDELDISESNLGVLLYRARMQMRLCLTKNWFGEKNGS